MSRTDFSTNQTWLERVEDNCLNYCTMALRPSNIGPLKINSDECTRTKRMSTVNSGACVETSGHWNAILLIPRRKIHPGSTKQAARLLACSALSGRISGEHDVVVNIVQVHNVHDNIFALWFLLLSSVFFPRLISAVADVYYCLLYTSPSPRD